MQSLRFVSVKVLDVLLLLPHFRQLETPALQMGLNVLDFTSKVILVFFEESRTRHTFDEGCQLFGTFKEQLVDFALPDGEVGCDEVDVLEHQVVFVLLLRKLFPIQLKNLALISEQSAAERQLVAVLEDEGSLNFAVLVLLGHLLVCLDPLPGNELAEVEEGQLAFLIAEAEHQGIQDVGLPRSVGAHDGGEVQQWPNVNFAL
jgi:hypothetical protein